MSDAPSDDRQLAFNREKWADELKLRQRELEIKAVEADAKAKDQERQAEQFRFTQVEASRNRWINPVIVAVFAAAIAAAGNAVVTLLNGTAQRAIEQIKSDQGLILEAIKANSDPDKAAANLRFLAETALISNPERRKEIGTFLDRRKPGEGPSLPSANGGTQRIVSGADLFQQTRTSVGLMIVNANNTNGAPLAMRGTCFVLNDQGYALTAAHLFPEGSLELKITVSLGSALSPSYPVELISVDKEAGLALVKLPTVMRPTPTKRARVRAQVAQAVFIVGFPQSSDLSLLSGSISSLDLERGGIGITAATSVGMSGSPIFNDAGEVIAVVIGRKMESGHTVAYPLQLASRLLALAGPEQ